jgi:hypothetical protein
VSQAFDVQAAHAEALAKYEQQRAALAIREKTHDLQFESYGRKGGSGHCWMTEVQLERAAQRLAKSNRAGGKTDFALGKSDHVMDASLVANAYLSEFVRHRDAHDIIHRASDLLRQVPCGPDDTQRLIDADAIVKEMPDCFDATDAHNLGSMIEGYKVARAQMGRLQPERPCVDLSRLKMVPSIQLASGVYFNFLEPRTTPLEIADMAAGLSRICRYTGQLAIDEDDIYSVAQHSVLASENCEADCDPYEALLHDRAESVMNDMASPLKQLLLDYKEIEDRVEEATGVYYDVPHPMSDACKRIDLRMLATEKRDLMPTNVGDEKWVLIADITPLPFTLEPWRPSEARHRFLHRYYFLCDGDVPKPEDPYSRPHPNAPENWIEALRTAWGANPFEVGNPGR